MSDTIYALSTPLGKSAVAVVRLSGPNCLELAQKICPGAPFKPRVASLRTFQDPASGLKIDKVLALYFQAPHSFTGEDCLELHLHGSRAIIEACLRVLSTLPELRLAEPGEFTKRAWLNEKMTMSEAESLRQLIDAETEEQRKQALRNMSGHLSAAADGWRSDLIEGLSYLEAAIDFVDEDDISEATISLAFAPLERTLVSMRHHLATASAGIKLHEGISVALVGAPNAGKSSLLNALAKRDIAIVTDIPGTTRDVLHARLDLGGVPFTFYDTAGLRETEDRVEQIGVSRAYQTIETADIVLLFANEMTPREFSDLHQSLIKQSQSNHFIIIQNKCDLELEPELLETIDFQISCKTGEGLEDLTQHLSHIGSKLTSSEAIISSERQRLALDSACQELQKALDLLHSGVDEVELVSSHLHYSERALQRLIGRIDVDDILDQIFSKFCIGK